MSFAGYIKRTWVEALLCVLAALAMGLTVVQAFHIPQETACNVALVAAATGVPVLLLHAVAFNKRSVLVGVPVLVLACIAGAVVLARLTPTQLFDDAYDNSSLVFVVCALTALVVFLLARTRPGTVVAFAVGCFTCGAVQFLYLTELVWPTILFMVSCASLYLCKGVARGAQETRVSAARDLPGAGMAVALTALAAILACGVFFAVVAPLNPPAFELKLITERYSLEEVRVSGITDLLHQRDQEQDSKNESDDTDGANRDNDERQQAQGASSPQDAGEDEQLGAGSLSMSDHGDPMNAVRYFQDNPWLLLLVPVILALLWLAVVLARRYARKRRLAAWQELPPRAEAEALHRHFCTVLAKIGLFERGAHTPTELAAASREQTARFECYGESATFADVTAAFVRVAYGGADPSRGELEAMEAYYRLIPARSVRTAGRLAHIRNFFRV